MDIRKTCEELGSRVKKISKKTSYYEIPDKEKLRILANIVIEHVLENHAGLAVNSDKRLR